MNSNHPLFRKYVKHTSLQIVTIPCLQTAHEDPFASVDKENEGELEQNKVVIYTDQLNLRSAGPCAQSCLCTCATTMQQMHDDPDQKLAVTTHQIVTMGL